METTLVGVGCTTFSLYHPYSSKIRIYISDGVFSYITNSKNVEGPISNVQIENGGLNIRL